MVRAPAAVPHPPPHPGPAAARDPSGFGYGLHPLSAALATRSAGLAAPRPRRHPPGHPSASGHGVASPGLGAAARLAARLASYDPADLEHLCLAGVVTWGRLRRDTGAPDDDAAAARLWDSAPLDLRPAPGKTRRTTPTRSAPLAFVIREDLPHFLDAEALDWRGLQGLSAAARDVAEFLETHGASFLADIARGTGHLTVRTERALWELVTRGQVTETESRDCGCCSPPSSREKIKDAAAGRVRPGKRCPSAAGRCGETGTRAPPTARQRPWRANSCNATPLSSGNCSPRRPAVPPGACCSRPTAAWRPRGEIRGGRFVGGFVGEQYALPDAVESMRNVRRLAPDTAPVMVSCTDPLNLVGILTPAPGSPCSRVSSSPTSTAPPPRSAPRQRAEPACSRSRYRGWSNLPP